MSDAGSPPAAPAAEVKPKADGKSIYLDDTSHPNSADDDRQHIKHQDRFH
jgi:hypothetical protein